MHVSTFPPVSSALSQMDAGTYPYPRSPKRPVRKSSLPTFAQLFVWSLSFARRYAPEAKKAHEEGRGGLIHFDIEPTQARARRRKRSTTALAQWPR
eukprot:6195720-Pleurochrysis_carterae.AAC.2